MKLPGFFIIMAVSTCNMENVLEKQCPLFVPRLEGGEGGGEIGWLLYLCKLVHLTRFKCYKLLYTFRISVIVMQDVNGN